MSFTSMGLPEGVIEKVNNWEWIFETQTYDRSADLWKIYYNGEYIANATNGQGDPSGDDFTKFGHFGTADEDDGDAIRGFR